MKKTVISLTVMAVGLATLIAGIVFLVLGLTGAPKISDGEYLASAGEWVMNAGTSCVEDDCAGVVWDFTEIGKGTLTTNDHKNDYTFRWALESTKIKIETEWLYLLENEYDYKIDRDAGTLTLTSGEEEFVFKRVGDEATGA